MVGLGFADLGVVVGLGFWISAWWWVLGLGFADLGEGWSWWPGCRSFLVVRTKGLGVVEFSI